MAIAVVLALGSAQAAGAAQGRTLPSDDGGRILLAANDAHAAGTAQKDADKTDAKDAKKEAVKAPSGPPPSKFWIVNVLRDNAALAIFLTLALGYYIGSIKIGQFSLGAVTGTLLVGVLLGQLDIAISAQVKSVFFTMFLFAVGYSVGPQFVRGVAHDGAPQAIFAVVIFRRGACRGIMGRRPDHLGFHRPGHRRHQQLRRQQCPGIAQQDPRGLRHLLFVGHHRYRRDPLSVGPQADRGQSRRGLQAIRGRDVEGPAGDRHGLGLAPASNARL